MHKYPTMAKSRIYTDQDIQRIKNEAAFGEYNLQDIQLERDVLSLLLTHGIHFPKAQKQLSKKHFADAWHQHIFTAMKEATDKDMEVDTLSVGLLMNGKGLFKNDAWEMELAEINDSKKIKDIKRAMELRIMIENHGTHDDIMTMGTTAVNPVNLRFLIARLNELLLGRQSLRRCREAMNKIINGRAASVALELNELSKSLRVVKSDTMFRIRTTSERQAQGEQEPELKELLGPLLRWSDTSLWFGGPGTGKSVLGIQAADAMSKGIGMFPEEIASELGDEPEIRYVLPNELGRPVKVMYLDLELKDRAFADRTMSGDRRHEFNDNLLIMDKDPDYISRDIKKYDQQMLAAIEFCVAKHQPEVFVVDNMTALTKRSLVDEAVAQEFMALFEYMNKKLGITIMAFAHTPKFVNPSEFLHQDNMAGSSIIQRFSENIIGLRTVYGDEGMIYIKECKTRNGVQTYGRENVLAAYMGRLDSGLLGFRFSHIDKEEHLIRRTGNLEEEDTSKTTAEDMYEDRLGGYQPGQLNKRTYEQIAYDYSGTVNWSAKKVERMIKDVARERIDQWSGQGAIPFHLDKDYKEGSSVMISPSSRPDTDHVPF